MVYSYPKIKEEIYMGTKLISKYKIDNKASVEELRTTYFISHLCALAKGLFAKLQV